MSSTPRTSPIQAVLFDLDGTLADSCQGIAATVNAVLAEHGQRPVAAAAVRALIGAPLEAIFESLGVAPPVERHADRYRALYPTLGVPLSPLFPGVRQTLDWCRAGGLRLALVTTKRTATAKEVVRACGIETYFEAIIGADAAAHHKPHPAPAQAALVRLGAAPGQSAVVGDTTFDVLMARAAGCRAIGAAWGYGSVDSLVAAGAHKIVHTPAQLPAALTAP